MGRRNINILDQVSIEKYQYPLYDIDPLDYNLEADYRDAVKEEKHVCGKYQYESRRYGIDVNAFKLLWI